ncbi:MAG: low molecular weight phosphotyrosine protein phosphatase [Clostridia bacterium]|nr:low molecular weight phosphotyrosine protein phosphatase [Clostridia bacterium]
MNILFVCHGNICRSPMAEFIMKDMLQRRGLADRVRVASCATSREEIRGDVGNPVYQPARAELARHGILCGDKRAVQLTAKDYAAYDLLIGMDRANIRNMQRITGGDPDGKMCRLLEYAGESADVADPWYSDRFDIAYRDIYRGCEALLLWILKHL